MRIVLGFLGWIAKMSGPMSRSSVNGMPSNWGVILFGGFIGFLLTSVAIEKGRSTELLFAIPCFLIALVFLISALLKHVIFQRTPPTASATPSANGQPFSETSHTPNPTTPLTKNNGQPLRVTGKLRLNEKTAQRFLDIPASMARLDGGELAILSQIDASSRTYGVVTDSRVGLWLLMPQRGSVRWEEGLLYHGFHPAPALRISYNDALQKNKASSAVLSFDSEATRAAVLRELQLEAAPGASAGAR